MRRGTSAAATAQRARWPWLAVGLALAQLLTFGGWLDGARRGRGDGPTTLAVDPESGRVFAGFWNARTIEEVGADDPRRRHVIVAGHRPTQLGWLPRSRALVFACYYEDHVCVVPLGDASPTPRCFVPDHGAGEDLVWRASGAGHATFPRPQGTFHGHVESFVVDPTTERLFAIAAHFDGIGLDKDAEWLAPLRWDGERLVSAGGGLLVRATSHDHDAQPLALDPRSGELWWVLPAERRVRRIEPTAMAVTRQSGPVGRLPVAMAIDARARRVWVGDGVRPELTALDADTLTIERRLATPGPVASLAFDDASGRLWVVSRTVGTIGVLEPGADEVRPVTVIDQPSAAAHDAVRNVLWTASLGDGAVHRVPPRAEPGG